MLGRILTFGELISRLLPESAAQLPRGELQKLRRGIAGSFLLAMMLTLFLPSPFIWQRSMWNLIGHITALGVMVLGTVGPRWLRAPWAPLFALGLYPSMAISGTLVVEPTAALRFGALAPLMAALFAGPRVVVMSVVILLGSVLFLGGPLTTTLSPREFQERMDMIFMVVCVGGMSLASEALWSRAEKERDAAEAARVTLAREQAAREEKSRLQARRAQHQLLRADLGIALADPGPLATSLQRCCEVLARLLGVATVSHRRAVATPKRAPT